MSNNVILVGPMGAGKTTLGKRLAKRMRREFVDVDFVIQDRLGVSVQTIFDTEGEEGFREREYIILKSILDGFENAIVATGGGCVLTERCRRIIIAELLVVHVDVGIDQQYERLKKDKKRPILQHSGDLRKKLITLREERHKIYRSVADIYVSTDRSGFNAMMHKIEKKLEGE